VFSLHLQGDGLVQEDAEVTGRRTVSVSSVARSEIIVANQISRRGRGDRTCTEPMGVEVPRLALFRAASGKCAGGWM
jgi:hypothetical protein